MLPRPVSSLLLRTARNSHPWRLLSSSLSSTSSFSLSKICTISSAAAATPTLRTASNITYCKCEYCACSARSLAFSSSYASSTCANSARYFSSCSSSSSSPSAAAVASESEHSHDDFKPVRKDSPIQSSSLPNTSAAPSSASASSSSSTSSKASRPSSVPLQELRDNMSDSELSSLISSDVSGHGVFLYMKGNPLAPRCGFSRNVAQILQHLNISFESRDVLQHDGLREAVKKFSDWPTLPQLYIDGEFVGGSDIVTQLFKSGELKKMLEKHTKN